MERASKQVSFITCALAWHVREVTEGLFELSCPDFNPSGRIRFICTSMVAKKGEESNEEFAGIPFELSNLPGPSVPFVLPVCSDFKEGRVMCSPCKGSFAILSLRLGSPSATLPQPRHPLSTDRSRNGLGVVLVAPQHNRD